MKRFLMISLLVLAACGRGEGDAASAEPAAKPEVNEKAAPKRYFISSANPYATEAGEAILKRGGSAVDAAIATQAMLGLTEPQSSGLGGGAFMIHYDPSTGILETYDGRETAPASATPERFLLEDGTPIQFYDAVAGGLSVGVPGIVRMLELAHEEHGQLPWPDLLEPAEKQATEGFSVSPRLFGLLERIPRLKQLPAAAAYFYDENGAPHPVGYNLKNPAYAETLSLLRAEGADVYYEGSIAKEIVEAVNNAPSPGGMTLEDLRNYKPVKRTPVCGEYRTYEICSMAPPSSGGVTVLQILSLLEPFDLTGAGASCFDSFPSADGAHLQLSPYRTQRPDLPSPDQALQRMIAQLAKRVARFLHTRSSSDPPPALKAL